MKNEKILDRDKVLSLFSLFSDLTGGGLARWQPFCDGAARRIEARLLPGADCPSLETESEMEALCTAAAALAYCDYLLLGGVSGGGAVDELRVGDIALKSGTGAAESRRDAEEIRDHFLAGVAHLLRPECPALLSTPERIATGEAP